MNFARQFVWHVVGKNPRLRAFITRLLVPDRDIDITLAGVPIRINRRREIGYYRAYRASQGNIVFRDELASLMNLALILERGDTFVDVGANVGLYSAVLGRLCRVWPENRWYAFEPNPDAFGRLIKTTSFLDTRVRNAGVSNQIGTLEFTAGAVSGVFGPTKNRSKYQYGASVSIPCVTLDSAQIEGENIILKIDVEGHEREVPEGATALFELGRVKAVYLDGYADKEVPQWLKARQFNILDGRSLEGALPKHSLLALKSHAA